jgi:ribonuclease E
MGLFRKKTARIRRTGSEEEERVVRRVDGQAVTVRKFSTEGDRSEATATTERQRSKPKPAKAREPRKTGGSRRPQRRPHVEVVPPPETARKQMLVRKLPHQTQIVVMEGPVLVEHYVARSDKLSLVGNVYLGKVRNVLPGMEAAFIDFGGARTESCTPET